MWLSLVVRQAKMCVARGHQSCQGACFMSQHMILQDSANLRIFLKTTYFTNSIPSKQLSLCFGLLPYYATATESFASKFSYLQHFSNPLILSSHAVILVTDIQTLKQHHSVHAKAIGRRCCQCWYLGPTCSIMRHFRGWNFIIVLNSVNNYYGCDFARFADQVCYL